MAEGNRIPHTVILNERNELKISGVTDVDSFDEEKVVAYTDLGELIISGDELHISRLDVESGDLSIEGNIVSMVYAGSQAKSKGFFSRLLK